MPSCFTSSFSCRLAFYGKNI